MLPTFAVIRHVGVGPLRFGMSREDVRSALSIPFEVFRRTPASIPADLFGSAGTFAYYSESGGLIAVEFAKRANVTFGDLDLTNTSTSKLIAEISTIDPAIDHDSSGFTSRAYGIGAWTEDDLGLPPQSVIIFAPGYYD
jgi:hypothetical protein